MNQSEILRKQLAKENSRADKNECNFLTAKKAIDKLLHIMFCKQDQRDDLEDAFEHITKICDEKDVKLTKEMEHYLSTYVEQQELLQKEQKSREEKSKKKKGFFGFN